MAEEVRNCISQIVSGRDGAHGVAQDAQSDVSVLADLHKSLQKMPEESRIALLDAFEVEEILQVFRFLFRIASEKTMFVTKAQTVLDILATMKVWCNTLHGCPDLVAQGSAVLKLPECEKIPCCSADASAPSSKVPEMDLTVGYGSSLNHQWKVEQSLEISSDVDRATITTNLRLIAEATSVKAAVDMLNGSALQMTEGVCAVYSENKEKHFLLYRSDKHKEALEIIQHILAKDFSVHNGSIGGEALLQARMTVLEAKRKCREFNGGCAGFCHAGPPTNDNVEIIFKSKWDHNSNAYDLWTSYQFHPSAQAPEIKVVIQRPKLTTAGTNMDLAAVAPPSLPQSYPPDHSKPLCVGDFIHFWSTSHNYDVYTKIVAVNAEDGSVQVECKPGVWIGVAEQREKIKRHFKTDEVKPITQLDQDARAYFNCLQTAVNPGGEAEMTRIRQHHLLKFRQANKDGLLTKAEFTAMHRHLSSQLRTSPDEQKFAALFPGFGVGNDGVLSDEEFRECYPRMIRLLVSSFRFMGKADLVRSMHQHTAKQDFEKKYELGKRLAAGVGGVTYLATKRGMHPAETVVVKCPKKPGSREDFDLLKDKSHPNVLKVFEMFQSPKETFIVMEYCPGGDLFGGVKYCFETFQMITLNWMAGVVQQSIQGVYYLHSTFKQCHNDLKPENILLDRKPQSISDVPRIMIADFGCVSDVNKQGSGDPRYQPPERWIGNFLTPGTYACDVWSLGVIMFELLSGGMLIFTNQRNICGYDAWKVAEGGQLVLKLKQGMIKASAVPDWNQIQTAGAGVHLCKAMLRKDASERIEMKEALHHEWFAIVAAEPAKLDASAAQHLRKRASLCSLKVALLNMVAQKLQNESLEKYHSIWKIFDTDNNGILTGEEFVQMLQSPTVGLDMSTAMELYCKADVDGSGSVDFNEFVALMLDPQKMTADKAEEAFKSIFTDLAGTKGMLSKEELAAAFPAEAASLIPRVFEEMDADGDGTVDFEEFSKFVSGM